MEPIGALPREVVDANSLKDMVGPCGLEPQTSTVSKTAGTAKIRGSRTRHHTLWVELWVRNNHSTHILLYHKKPVGALDLHELHQKFQA